MCSSVSADPTCSSASASASAATTAISSPSVSAADAAAPPPALPWLVVSSSLLCKVHQTAHGRRITIANSKIKVGIKPPDKQFKNPRWTFRTARLDAEFFKKNKKEHKPLVPTTDQPSKRSTNSRVEIARRACQRTIDELQTLQNWLTTSKLIRKQKKQHHQK
jgi:hypothetical protein